MFDLISMAVPLFSYLLIAGICAYAMREMSTQGGLSWWAVILFALCWPYIFLAAYKYK